MNQYEWEDGMKLFSVFCLIILISFSLHSSVTHIWPQSGTNDGIRSVKIYGGGFNSGISTLELQKSGYPSIYATNINVQSDNYLTCDFDLTGISPTTYNLIVNSDTLNMCFTVNGTLSYSKYYWDSQEVGDADWVFTTVVVADGTNSGRLDVFAGCYSGHVYQYCWNGNNWDKYDMGSGGGYLHVNDIAIGDADNDGKYEVYAGCTDGKLYQFTWTGSSWDITVIYTFNFSFRTIAVGDGDNDGLSELYVGCQDYQSYQIHWTGSSWQMTNLGSSTLLNNITIGDGDNDGEQEVYVASDDAHIYQIKWNGTSWITNDIGNTTGTYMNDVKIGDGDNDGDVEVYAVSFNGAVYQISWTGSYWEQIAIGISPPSDWYGIHGVAVGDGDNDGDYEVYGSSINYHIYQYKYVIDQWIRTDIGFGDAGMRDVVTGDVDNDGYLEVFGANDDYSIYRFMVMPYFLHDTLHDFGDLMLGDSSIWQFEVENVKTQNLIIDSIVTPFSEYSVINCNFPVVLSPGDSTLIDLMFKPDSFGDFPCSLQIFINDSFLSVIYIAIDGECHHSNLLYSVTHIWPQSGTNNGLRPVKIFGCGFNLGVSAVELQRSGYPSIYATNINVQSDNYLTCDFNLSGGSAATYNLVVNSDTLKLGFQVNKYFDYNFPEWFLAWSSEGHCYGVSACGDGNNDGNLDIYTSNDAGPGQNDGFLQIIYTNNWNVNPIEAIWHIMSVAVGDGNNDHENEVYLAASWGIYQYKFINSSWVRTNLGFANSGSFWDILVGDADQDGEFEVYGAAINDSSLYQYKWNGYSWDEYIVGSCPGRMSGVSLGDGNNDGELELYTCCYDCFHVYQFKWVLDHWEQTLVGIGSTHIVGIDVGDVDNDDEFEVYAACCSYQNSNIFQFKYSNGNWTQEIIFDAKNSKIQIGDVDNDGIDEICNCSRILEYIDQHWNEEYIFSLPYPNNTPVVRTIGDVNRDGIIDVSTGANDFLYFSLLKKAIDISDTVHSFLVNPGDSVLWQFSVRNMKNAGLQNLVIDSIVFTNSSFYLIDSLFPSIILNDSTKNFEVLFKPESIGVYSCSLSIFSNDTLKPVDYIHLKGGCDSVSPSRVLLIFPENTGYYPHTAVGYIWHQSYDTGGIDHYILQHALDSNFTNSLNEYNVVDTFLYNWNWSTNLLKYYWRVKAVSTTGIESPWSEVWSFTFSLTGINEEITNLYDKFSCSLYYINQDLVNFQFIIPSQCDVCLKIYDLSGRLVETPISRTLSPGTHQIPFHAERSGIYFYRLESPYGTETGKFMVVR